MKAVSYHIGNALALAITAVVAGGGALTWAKDDPGSGGDDKAQRAIERAAREAGRAQERADKDAARYAQDRARITERADKDPVKAAEELTRLEADRAKDEAKAAEDADKVAADFEEEQRKAAEDAARDAQRASEGADDRGENYGSSAEMHNLAENESPQFDRRGFPVRHGEVVGLNMKPEKLSEAQRQGFRLIAEEHLPALGTQLVRLAAPDGVEAQDALRRVRQIDPDGVYDYVHFYGLQYQPSGGSSGVAGTVVLPRKSEKLTIGMIDTGVVGHPSLKGASIKTRDFASGQGTPPVDHGTAIASILVSEGSSSLYVANIFRGGETGAPYTSAEAVVKALEWMVASHVPVVNISLAGPRNAVLDALIQRASGTGMAIVAAAGNGGPTAPPAYPAALRPVVAVTAVDRNMHIYRYANQGRYITVAARGVGEPAAQAKGGIGQFSGTSFATPHIAAWMARCMKSGADDCSAKLRRNAHDLGDPGYDTVYGFGYVP
ncbi:S8 family serine peptidase [Sphingobium subterraneum]|uniref:Peptidase S8/S53 domain-containing protein n=1 Tax=Sphingobium subterraneum TaxID=627688 RepID=A0A841J0Z4_9SPHN|nr:S8 family serine peptidase [Sphingobium subterraneum]MBB6124603.1 hypothetical protein [Sphingobium subterraneum]